MIFVVTLLQNCSTNRKPTPTMSEWANVIFNLIRTENWYVKLRAFMQNEPKTRRKICDAIVRICRQTEMWVWWYRISSKSNYYICLRRSAIHSLRKETTQSVICFTIFPFWCWIYLRTLMLSIVAWPIDFVKWKRNKKNQENVPKWCFYMWNRVWEMRIANKKRKQEAETKRVEVDEGRKRETHGMKYIITAQNVHVHRMEKWNEIQLTHMNNSLSLFLWIPFVECRPPRMLARRFAYCHSPNTMNDKRIYMLFMWYIEHKYH